MYNCVIKICEMLGCERADLKVFLSLPHQRNKVVEFLRNFDLFLAYNTFRRHIDFFEISEEDSDNLFVCGGYKRITVNQYFFARHRVDLVHANLPCLVQHTGFSQRTGRAKLAYYPLEIISMAPKTKPKSPNSYA